MTKAEVGVRPPLTSQVKSGQEPRSAGVSEKPRKQIPNTALLTP